MNDKNQKMIIIIFGIILIMYLIAQIYDKYDVLQNQSVSDISIIQNETTIFKEKFAAVKKILNVDNKNNSANVNNELQSILAKANCRLINISSIDKNESALIFSGTQNSILNFIDTISPNKNIVILKIKISDNQKNKIVTMEYKIK